MSWYQAPVGWMYAALFLDSSFLRIGWPARSAIMPLLVPKELFENAVKWRTSFFQITGITGPAIGGFLAGSDPVNADFQSPAFAAAGLSWLTLGAGYLVVLVHPHQTLHDRLSLTATVVLPKGAKAV